MMSLGAVTFAFPWILTALAILPLVWLLLRVTPPAARRLTFPAIRLLFGMVSNEKSSARTPWWLMLMRLSCITLIIIALADPVLNQRQSMRQSPLVVVVDDGWAAASTWPERQAALVRLLESAVRYTRPVILATTAPADAGAQNPLSFGSASDALAVARALEAKSWSTDRQSALQRLQDANPRPPAESVWLTDGVASDTDIEMAAWLQRLGRLTVLTSTTAAGPIALGPAERVPDSNGNTIEVTVRRPASESAVPMISNIIALDQAGRTVARAEANFDAGTAVTSARFVVPTELGNLMTQLIVENESSAASVFLLDDRWTRRPVGIVSANPDGIVTPLLEDGFYATQALLPYADVHAGTIVELLERNLAMIILASGNRVTSPEVALLEPWLHRGGVLIRFAGATLDGNVDPLLPVRLRGGGRTFGGTMSWTEPVGMATFPDDSPFAGLAVPDDVLVSTQVLAEPSAGLSQRTWARLEDGTPLVTAERRDSGWIVLFHVTATPNWSTLPLSGVMVDMLRRILDLSRGVEEATSVLPQGLSAREILSGTGQLIVPPPTVVAIDRDDIADPDLGPTYPPGYYGSGDTKIAINLGPSIGPIVGQGRWPSDVTVTGFESVAAERTLKPWLLFFALALFVIDFMISLFLRGITPQLPLARVGAATASIALLILIASPHHALGADAIDPAVIDAVLETRLAYIRTGRQDIDQLSAQGLGALTKVLAARTSAVMATPADINPETDELFPYPVVYWRITPEQTPPSEKAAQHINDYLGRGGMIVFDAPNQVGANANDDGQQVSQALNNVLARLNVPPLVQIPETHVLHRSFYLLPDLPGRFTGAPVYVERGSITTDGVSSIIIGSHDWAAAWARDSRGLPLYPAVPSGERQREWSYRFGVNLVMYALTGNYKADQVHLPAIMQRLTQ
ncbi:MAG: DUF4159 domain-containing protein [Rhodospirillaceae bacterium]|nr:DUF4159 domain-containing protein [Rhodospirillaceae bacterium]